MHEKMKRKEDGSWDDRQPDIAICDEFDGCEFEQVEKASTIYKVDPGDPDFD